MDTFQRTQTSLNNAESPLRLSEFVQPPPISVHSATCIYGGNSGDFDLQSALVREVGCSFS
jgi:hypothetical protein